MSIPHLATEQIAQVSVLTAQYITTQRERYAPAAASLSSQQKAAMAGFFSLQLLDTTRLLALVVERVANPDFYPALRNLGFNNLVWPKNSLNPSCPATVFNVDGIPDLEVPPGNAR